MKLSTIIISTIAILGGQLLFAQKMNNHEFEGQILIDGKKAENVEIVVYDDNKPKYTYNTTRNGKFFFNSGAEKYYTLEFKKDGYYTKRVIINTNDTKKHLGDLYKYRFDINMEVISESDTHYDRDFPTAIIEYDNLEEEFNMSDKYAANQLKLQRLSEAQLAAE